MCNRESQSRLVDRSEQNIHQSTSRPHIKMYMSWGVARFHDIHAGTLDPRLEFLQEMMSSESNVYNHAGTQESAATLTVFLCGSSAYGCSG